jgi:hypothetical protein
MRVDQYTTDNMIKAADQSKVINRNKVANPLAGTWNFVSKVVNRSKVVNPLVGTWSLISAEARSENNDVSYVFGRNAVGCLIYSANGYMSLAIMSANRQLFSCEDLARASVMEKAAAAETYTAYSGTYELQGDRVIHHVKLSFFPNWVDNDLERIFHLAGDTLTLKTPPFVHGNPQTVYIIWKRVE